MRVRASSVRSTSPPGGGRDRNHLRPRFIRPVSFVAARQDESGRVRADLTQTRSGESRRASAATMKDPIAHGRPRGDVDWTARAVPAPRHPRSPAPANAQQSPDRPGPSHGVHPIPPRGILSDLMMATDHPMDGSGSSSGIVGNLLWRRLAPGRFYPDLGAAFQMIRKAANRLANPATSRVWHSQTVSTRQPIERSLRPFRRSRATFRSRLACQYSA